MTFPLLPSTHLSAHPLFNVCSYENRLKSSIPRLMCVLLINTDGVSGDYLVLNNKMFHCVNKLGKITSEN